MKCVNCGKEAEGRSKYCSATCKTIYNRNKNRNTKSVTPNRNSETVTPDQLQAARDRRTNPDLLNWGDPMTSAELHDAGLRANRVPIPGDWDYNGVYTPQD